MKKKKVLSLFIISLISYASRSQDSIKHLSLQEAITASVSNNDAIKLSALDEQIARAKYRQTDAILLPQVNVSYTAATTNNPLNAFGFKLQQKSITEADFNPHLLNNPSATPDFSAKFELQQPLLNADMLYQRKAAAKQVEMYQLLSNRTKKYLCFETEKAYLQLQMAWDENKVLNEALATSKAVYKTSKDYYNQGLIQKSDLLNAELHVLNTETQVKSSRSGIQDASDMLSILMGQLTGTVYTIDPIGITNAVIADNPGLSDERPDFKALQKGMEAYDMMIKSSKMSYLPRLNAFASWQLNDKTMFGFNANAYFAGIQMSWNIFNGNRTRNTISQQSLEKEKLARQLDQQKSEAQFQINHARRQLLDASFVMKQQQLAVEQASEALRVLQNRYTQGLVKTTDVLMAQTQLSQQKLGYVHAVFNYNLAAASLQFLTTSK
ncbi:MAG TPA: TolC family protein [Chitinophagaceae bacterium]